MSVVLDRDELEQSPLADLHLLGNELGIDGFRRLRKADLIDAILAKQSGEAPAADADASEEDADERPARPRRSRGGRGGRGRARDLDEDAESSTTAAEQAAATADDDEEDRPVRNRRSRGGRGDRRDEPKPAEDKTVEGVVELMANGSGFIRVNHPDTSDDDVYVSAAQVKRCELVTGDKVGGPLRPPRRSERFPSLIRVDTINGKPSEEVAEGTKFEDLPATFASDHLRWDTDHPTLQGIMWLAPFGKGSRVTVVGDHQSGKSETLRQIARALTGQESLELSVVLAGTRPEEISDWTEGIAPAAAVSFAASSDTQAQCIEQVVEQGRRVAARGGDAVVVIDSLEYVPASAARRLMGAARNIKDGGSLTIIASAPALIGGETTVVKLDRVLTRQLGFPGVDVTESATMRPELLVGEKGAEEIARKRSEVFAQRGE